MLNRALSRLHVGHPSHTLLASTARQCLFSTGGNDSYSGNQSPYASWDPTARGKFSTPSADKPKSRDRTRNTTDNEDESFGQSKRNRMIGRPVFEQDESDAAYKRIFATRDIRKKQERSDKRPSPQASRENQGSMQWGSRDGRGLGEDVRRRGRDAQGNMNQTYTSHEPRRQQTKPVHKRPISAINQQQKHRKHEGDVALRPLQRHEIVDVVQVSRDFGQRVRIVDQIKNGPVIVREEILQNILENNAVVYMAQHPESSRVILTLLRIVDTANQIELCADFHEHVFELATNKFGRIVLEDALDKLPASERDVLVDKLLSSPEELLYCIKDPIGAFVVQKVMRQKLEAELSIFYDVLKGNVVALSQHPVGGFFVTLALETFDAEQAKTLMFELIESKEITLKLALDKHGSHVLRALLVNHTNVPGKVGGAILKALKGHVAELASCKTGSEVLLDAFENMRFPTQRDLFLDELLISPEIIRKFCADEYASPLVQWALENGRAGHREKINTALKGNMAALMSSSDGISVIRKLINSTSKKQWTEGLGGEVATSPVDKVIEYTKDEAATFVIQRLLEKGSTANKSAIKSAMTGKMLELSTHKTAHFVVRSALSCLEPADATELIAELVATEANVTQCAKNHFGSFVLQRVLDKGTPDQCSFVKAVLTDLLAETQRKERARALHLQQEEEARKRALSPPPPPPVQHEDDVMLVDDGVGGGRRAHDDHYQAYDDDSEHRERGDDDRRVDSRGSARYSWE